MFGNTFLQPCCSLNDEKCTSDLGSQKRLINNPDSL